MTMDHIASGGGREFYLRIMAPGDELGAAFDGDPYPALIWAVEPTTPAQKHRLCAELIASGCRYVVCGGAESSAWEEAADEVFAAQELSDEELDALHVMTTSHPDEPPDEVAFFFVHNTHFGGHGFRRSLVLMIGDEPGMRGRLVDAIRRQAEPV